MKRQVIGAGLTMLRATRLHAPLARWTRGQGAILMLHHVRPFDRAGFSPNRLLEIEPAFLDAALTRIKALGYDIVSMDTALARIGIAAARPFVALTFDDGYIDTATHALPILEKHAAPFTLHVTTGFADRTARLWWVELEAAVRELARIEVEIDGRRLVLPAADDDEKRKAFEKLYRALRVGPEAQLLAVIGALAAQAGIDTAAIPARLCVDWNSIVRLARHPLGTIGAHTLTHPMLAKHDESVVRHELGESRRQIEMRIGLPVRHLAYPVGDPTAAGRREHAIAAALGFSSAVTTRPGLIFPAHRNHATALPRLSLNGHFQNVDALEALLTGVPFAVWNRGRRVVV